MTKRLIQAASLSLLLLLAFGCGEQQHAGNTNAGAATNAAANTHTTTNANTGAAASANASPATTNAAGAGNTVEVKLTEFKIEMPSTLSAGPTTFKVTNTGKAEHSFEFEGQGMEKKLGSDLGPGETKTLQADLKPGAYEAYCPVANHKGRGMSLKLTVK